MRNAWLLAALVLSGATAACSGSAPAPTATSPAAPATSTPGASTGSTGGSTAGPTPAPGGDCLTGTYALKRLVGVGDQSTFGTGEGGDMSVAFTAGRYTFTGHGKKPMKLTLAGRTGNLLVDGTITGTYSGEVPSIEFTVGTSSGTASLSAGGQQQRLSMAQVGQVLAPRGSAQVQCQGTQMAVNLDAGVLEFERA